MDSFLKLDGKIDRRNPRDEGDSLKDVYMRENLLVRDSVNRRPKGTGRALDAGQLTGIPTWEERYYTVETGQQSPKTFCYTIDGKLWVIQGTTATIVREDLNLTAYPKSCMYKLGDQAYMYMVDGLNLYKYDGNNNNSWERITVNDADGNPFKPIDVIEHLDRIVIVSDTSCKISVNLEPDNFDDATDSLEIIVGSGRGRNKGLAKILNTLYFATSEGWYVLYGDVISAVSSTFSIKKVNDRAAIALRTIVQIKGSGAIFFLSDDYNVWKFTGSTSCEKLTHLEKLEDFINPSPDSIVKAVATYENYYYKLSFVENTEIYNKLEYWYDTIDTEQKGTFIRGRNVSYYMQADATREEIFYHICRSDIPMIMIADTGYNFDGTAIRSRLWTKDVTPSKTDNVRFSAFYPELEPHGYQNIIIAYLLDGRLDGLSPSSRWTQSLMGEVVQIGQFAAFPNQTQFTDRIRPKINYSVGKSISFYIDDSTMNEEFALFGIGIEYIKKGRKKGHKVNQ